MSGLPIVRRELLVAAGRKGTYWQRGLFGVAAFLVASMFAMTAGGAPALAGSAVFWVLAWSAFVICLLEGIRAGSDALAWEQRQGTLGLLFLTDLRGHDIVLGKLAATAINSFSLLLAMLPVFALPLLLGGVTSGESARVMLVGFPVAAVLGAAIRQQTDGLELVLFLLPIAMGWFVMFLLDLYAVSYAGLWFGLSSARVEAAIAKTAAGVLLLPWLTLMVPLMGCLGWLVWPVFWIIWASNRLNSQFHARATEPLQR